MAKVQINTVIPVEWYQKVKKNRWKHNEIYGLGLLAKDNNPPILSRVKELEASNEKLYRQVEYYRKELFKFLDGVK